MKVQGAVQLVERFCDFKSRPLTGEPEPRGAHPTP
jgi:hypothetical protein